MPCDQKGCIDFRTLEVVLDGSDRQRSPVRRRDAGTLDSSHAVSPSEREPTEETGHHIGLQVEWGHGQDPVKNVAFAPYDANISDLLEAAYGMYKAGSGLKGITFTAANNCDYLVDFVKMQQTRMVTRRVRPIYRHSVSVDTRAGVQFGTELPCKLVVDSHMMSRIPRPLVDRNGCANPTSTAASGRVPASRWDSEDKIREATSLCKVLPPSGLHQRTGSMDTGEPLAITNSVISTPVATSAALHAQDKLARLARWVSCCSGQDRRDPRH